MCLKYGISLQDGYVSDLCMRVDQLVTFGGCCPFGVDIPSKPEKYGIRILLTMLKFLLKFLNKLFFYYHFILNSFHYL